jgi:hypothetical protein
MDARQVWETWRRILTDDRLVDRVLHPDAYAEEGNGLTPSEKAIVADYARTPLATAQNIGMYRQGLVRNALGALSLAPRTYLLLERSELDVDAVATDFVRSIGYVDHGPHFWRIAGKFIAYLAGLSTFARRSWQDVLALEAAAVALAQRLGESGASAWPDVVARQYHPTDQYPESMRFVATNAAVIVTTQSDLTDWIENPDDFDAEQSLEPATRHWLVVLPAAEATHTYAELSERAVHTFGLLSTPKTVVELSEALNALPVAETVEVIDALTELGVVIADSPA